MANVTAYTSLDMINPDVSYGYVSSYDSTHISLSDGIHTGTYYGSFSYSAAGDVYGTLTGYKSWEGGTLTLSVTGASVNAFDYYSAIQSGDGELAVGITLAGNDSVTGSRFDDSLAGFLGKDTIDGGAGNDLILGGIGTDRLVGGSGADSMSGEGGNDRLSGGAGSDNLNSGGGSDTLAGGSGKDVLNGGADDLKDTFDFNIISESGLGLQADRVENFLNRVDEIDLSGIDANSTTTGNSAFEFNGTTARAHSVWYAEQSGGVSVFGDVDGDNVADFEIFLADISLVRTGDFIL